MKAIVVVLITWILVFWNVSTTETSQDVQRFINLHMKRRLSDTDGAKGIPWPRKKE